MMDIHAFSKGVVLYFAFVFGLVFLINANHFQVDYTTFTILLMTGIFIIGFMTGKSSKKHGVLNSLFVGFFSALIMLFLLSNEIVHSLMLNVILGVFWCTLSMLGGVVGNKLRIYDR